MLVFLDLEATGIDERTECILEVGVAVTDDALNIVDTCEVLVRPLGGYDMSKMDPKVLEMHTKNNLLEECRLYGARRYEVEEVLLQFMAANGFTEPGKATIAGNSVYYDLFFLREHMPRFHVLFSHRIVDVTSFNEMARRWDPKLHQSRPRSDDNHRALSDCKGSIATLAHYRNAGLFGG
jgi:oligoribonuclease